MRFNSDRDTIAIMLTWRGILKKSNVGHKPYVINFAGTPALNGLMTKSTLAIGPRQTMLAKTHRIIWSTCKQGLYPASIKYDSLGYYLMHWVLTV
jgi:hypothetical protein